MKSLRHRLEKLLQSGSASDPASMSWTLERIDGVLTSPCGQTFTDEEYQRRVREGEVLYFVWTDEVEADVCD
jgi:hypothetical protein